MNSTLTPPAGATRAAASATLDEAADQTHTLREIRQQPAVWQQMAQAMAAQRAPLDAFLAPLQGFTQTRVVLTGAGSSAYIGDALAPALTARGLGCVASVPTTDIVSDPAACLPRTVPTLLVSFARSGNSPESLAAVERADAALTECRHLVVSCHAQGALHRWAAQQRHAHALELPEATHDRSFAMTSSFSTMLMSAGMAFGALDHADVAAAAADADQVLATAEPLIADLAARRFERIVYLGSHALQGIAREGALKMLELTDGRVATFSDTPLGFRHGPKTVLNARTLVVVFVHPEPGPRRYDLDLLREICADGAAGQVVAVGLAPEDAPAGAVGVPLAHTSSRSALAAGLPSVVWAQLLGLQHCLALGASPDNPSLRGIVNRVVQGVTIHPWP